jgi:hypothetical protein
MFVNQNIESAKMKDFNRQYEFFKDGLLKTVIVKELKYDLVEFTIKTKLTDADGKIITDDAYTSFFNTNEFMDFFEPIINDLKASFENANSNK